VDPANYMKGRIDSNQFAVKRLTVARSD